MLRLLSRRWILGWWGNDVWISWLINKPKLILSFHARTHAHTHTENLKPELCFNLQFPEAHFLHFANTSTARKRNVNIYPLTFSSLTVTWWISRPTLFLVHPVKFRSQHL